MAYKTLIGVLAAICITASVAVAGILESKNLVPGGVGEGYLVSGTAGDSYVTTSTFQWVLDIASKTGLFSLCYSVYSELGTPQVAVKYQVAPDPGAGFTEPYDSAGADLSQIVDDTSNVGGNGYYCIPGDYFPTWTNSIRLFPWGRLIFYGTGTNPTDTYMSNVWLIRY